MSPVKNGKGPVEGKCIGKGLENRDSNFRVHISVPKKASMLALCQAGNPQVPLASPGSLTFNSLKITDVSKLLVLTYKISSNFEEEFLQVTGLFGCSFFNTDI